MKKTQLLAPLSALVILAILLVTGCKKDNHDTLTPAEEEQAATASNASQTESEFIFNDVFDNVMGVSPDVGIGGTGIFGKRSSGSSAETERDMNTDSLPCFTVTTLHTNPPGFFPVKITIDFGAGCTGPDGHRRSGKIITEYTGRLTEPGKSATTVFDGFTIDGLTVRGIHKITNTTSTNQHQFTVTVREGRIGRPNGDFTEWRSDRVITQIEGNGTLLPFDDIFRITGNAQGHVKNGNLNVAWQSEITEPLIKRFTCHWISRGVIRTRRETLPSGSPWVAILNFGDGNCDFAATLTINGTTHDIQLPH